MRLQTFARRFPDATGVLALSFVVLIVFWPQLFGGQAYFWGDLELYFYPLGEFWHRELVQGRLPLWNPYLFGGVPFAGNPQASLLYPPSALLLGFPSVTALSLSLVLHVWGSGAAFFLWLRRGRWQLGAPAALLGALSWMLGGFFLSKAQFPNMLATLAWVPLVLWNAEKLVEAPNVRASVRLGAILGLQLLAAHAQMSLFSIYLSFFYALSVWLQLRPRPAARRWMMGFAGALVLAALLDAGQLLPVLENLRGAGRQALSLHSAPRFFLPPWAISNLFAPYAYGNPASGTWTQMGGGNFWETACYLGIAPFGLALWWTVREKRRFWPLVAVLSLVLAMGVWGGLYIAAFYLVPGVSRFHDAGRFLLGAAVAFPVLAALGAQKLRQGALLSRRLVIFGLVFTILDLVWFARGIYPLRPVSIITAPNLQRGRDAMLDAKQARIWQPDRKVGGRLFVRYDDYRFRTRAHDERYAPVLQPNIQIWGEMLDAHGYDPIAPQIVAERFKSLEIQPDATRISPQSLARLSEDSVRLFPLWRERPLEKAPGLTEIYRSPWRFEGQRYFLFRNDFCLPRARFQTEISTKWQPAQITTQGANFLSIEVPGDARRFELADNFVPGWSADEGGAKLPLRATLRATRRGFRALDLKPKNGAKRRLKMIYEPQSFRLGTFLSLCALSFGVAVWMGKRRFVGQ
ncbi:MAG TPA: hypothetical protein VF627_09065 [Abditibacterium sp.]